MNYMIEQYQKEWISYIRHKRFATSTYKTYTSSVEWFLSRCTKEPKLYSEHDIREVLLELDEKNTINSIITAIKQFYFHVLGIELDYRKLPYTVKQTKIQPIYLHEEVLKIIAATKSTKQKAILSLIVDCGLRINESVAIDLKDCNSKERSIIIRGAKGSKDRIVYPSKYVWDLIRVYYNTWHTKPTRYLFEGQKKQMPYTDSSIRQFVERSCGICGIEYKGIHAFRRYSITWSHEQGASLSSLAIRSGHVSTRTIERHYLNHSPTFLRNIPSPLNQISC